MTLMLVSYSLQAVQHQNAPTGKCRELRKPVPLQVSTRGRERLSPAIIGELHRALRELLFASASANATSHSFSFSQFIHHLSKASDSLFQQDAKINKIPALSCELPPSDQKSPRQLGKTIRSLLLFKMQGVEFQRSYASLMEMKLHHL